MPDTLNLSASAIAVLRFEIQGYHAKDKERRLPAYRELSAAGIMEPVPGSDVGYRLTEDGWDRRQGVLREAEERIERERHAPPPTQAISRKRPESCSAA